MTKARDVATQGGLTLISTQTLTASAGVSFTNLVVGERYRINWRGYMSADNVAVYARFRENTTDKATTYYGGIVGYGYSNYNLNAGINNATVVELVRVGSQSPNNYVAQFFAELTVQSSSTAQLISTAITHYSPELKVLGTSNAAMSNCNGISIYPSSGTFTGSISLYKYNV